MEAPQKSTGVDFSSDNHLETELNTTKGMVDLMMQAMATFIILWFLAVNQSKTVSLSMEQYTPPAFELVSGMEKPADKVDEASQENPILAVKLKSEEGGGQLLFTVDTGDKQRQAIDRKTLFGPYLLSLQGKTLRLFVDDVVPAGIIREIRQRAESVGVFEVIDLYEKNEHSKKNEVTISQGSGD
jgi:hypothetical protein